MFLIHGDNVVASRELRFKVVEKAHKAGVEVVALDGKKLELVDLMQALGSASLFGDDRLVVIDGLMARPASKARKEILGWLATADTKPESLVMWEGKSVTAAQSKKLNPKQVQEFKLPKVLFNFLDSIRPNNAKGLLAMLSSVRQTEADELVFVMIARQVRLLLAVKTGDGAKLPAWQRNKLSRQASLFELGALKRLQRRLVEIDHSLKTGNAPLTLPETLDILMLEI